MGNEVTKHMSTTSTSETGEAPTARAIKIMDRNIRRRVRKGVAYNMKVVIRGAKGTGKTSLYHRLQGHPIPETYISTPEIQTANIHWNFRGSEELIKIEIWDVVDEGYINNDSTESKIDHTFSASAGSHRVGAVDAKSVDVYSGASCIIFVTDLTKWETFEYVKAELCNVPRTIPTLVLGNFRDLVDQRKAFREDIHKALFDPLTSKQKKHPYELHYFECSFKNCYGLKVLHQYLNMPFLQLKLATLRQQVMLLEADCAKAKSDVHVSIAEQRYHDYMAFLRISGSDIRTGRARSSSDLKKEELQENENLQNGHPSPNKTSMKGNRNTLSPRLSKSDGEYSDIKPNKRSTEFEDESHLNLEHDASMEDSTMVKELPNIKYDHQNSSSETRDLQSQYEPCQSPCHSNESDNQEDKQVSSSTENENMTIVTTQSQSDSPLSNIQTPITSPEPTRNSNSSPPVLETTIQPDHQDIKNTKKLGDAIVNNISTNREYPSIDNPLESRTDGATTLPDQLENLEDFEFGGDASTLDSFYDVSDDSD